MDLRNAVLLSHLRVDFEYAAQEMNHLERLLWMTDLDRAERRD